MNIKNTDLDIIQKIKIIGKPQPNDYILWWFNTTEDAATLDLVQACCDTLREAFPDNTIIGVPTIITGIETMGKEVLIQQLEKCLTWVKGIPDGQI